MPVIRKYITKIRCLIMDISKKLMDPIDLFDGFAKMIDGSIDGSIKVLKNVIKVSKENHKQLKEFI
jgi:hypothetical protein